MNVKTMLLPLLCLCCLGLGHAGDPKELVKLEGNWITTTLNYDGKDFDKLKLRFIFKGNQASVEGNDAVKREYTKLTIKIDASTKPPLLDMKVADGVQKDANFEGIYELKDGTLKICAKIIGNERPNSFDTPAQGSNNVLLVLKKE